MKMIVTGSAGVSSGKFLPCDLSFPCRFAEKLALFAIAVGLLYICSKYHGQGEYAVPIFVCSVIGFLTMGAALVLARHRRFRLERVFLILFVPLSLWMMIGLPVFTAPDEGLHLNMAYRVSSCQALSPPSRQVVPKGFFAEMGKGPQMSFRVRDVVRIARSSAARIDTELVKDPTYEAIRVYPVFAYLPHGMAMRMVGFFSDNRFALFYGARLGALALTTLLFFFAVKWAPCGKNIILFLSLMPMTLQEAASAAVDGLAIANLTLLVAFVLMTLVPGFVLARKYWVVACFLSVGVIAFKVMYIPFLALFCLVPAQCMGGRRARRLFLAAVFGAAFAAMLVWLITSIMPLMGEEASRVSSKAIPQIMMTLSHPLKTAEQFGRTLLVYSDYYANGFFGQDLSWLNLGVPSFVKLCLMAILAGIVALDRPLFITLDAVKVRRWLISSSVVSLFVVAYSLLVWWTDVATSDVISGIQGRYFIPVSFALLLALRKPQTISGGESYPYLWKAYVCLAFVDLCALNVVLSGKF